MMLRRQHVFGVKRTAPFAFASTARAGRLAAVYNRVSWI
jgi:hypothetical protein